MKARSITLFLLVTLFGLSEFSWSADVRTWSDRKGRTLEASLLSVEGEEVVLQLKDGREVRVKISTLSAADGAYLKEYAGTAMADLTAGKLGVPEKEARIDTGTFEKRDDAFLFPGTEIAFEIFQTEHFLVMTDGSLRPSNIAETAERLWYGMAFQHPTFREKFGDKRRAIFAIEDEENQAAVGQAYAAYLQSIEENEASIRVSQTWANSTGSTIVLPQDVADPFGLFREARVFKVNRNNENSFKDVFGPFLTNALSSDMISTQMGGVSDFGRDGYFALVTGHAYYKEIQLAGKSATTMISAEYDNDELFQTRGFGDGTGWAKELRKMVRKGDATPSVKDLYYYNATNLNPTQLVLLYSFSHFAQSSPGLLAGYARMAERIDTSNQVPEAIELAKLLGFETVEELERAWIEHIESSNFKS